MQHIDFKGKKALVRVDFNVPLNEDHEITDDTRIRKALPTINHILDHGGAVILMSHLGRPQKKLLPDGQIDRKNFTLRHLVLHLQKLLDRPVTFSSDCVGAEAQENADELQPGDVLLLENTRFHKGEKKGDPAFAKQLAGLADIYINDAFGTAHRAHASTTVVAQAFDKAHKGFGLLMQSEIENATKVLNAPEHPFVVVFGGAKVSDKIGLIDRFLELADEIIIGGAMAYTFVKSQGGEIGKSLVEDDKLDVAASLLEKAKKMHKGMHLPVDSVIAEEISEDAETRIVGSDEIPDNAMGLDIGPQARSTFDAIIRNGKMVLWNGPMGVFEIPSLAQGSFAIANSIAESSKKGAYSLVGGGDSVSAVNKSGVSDQISFISTGGGAMLEFLEGKDLPGIKAIQG